MPTGVAVPAAFPGIRISPSIATCHVRYHIALLDNRSIGQLGSLIPGGLSRASGERSSPACHGLNLPNNENLGPRDWPLGRHFIKTACPQLRSQAVAVDMVHCFQDPVERVKSTTIPPQGRCCPIPCGNSAKRPHAALPRYLRGLRVHAFHPPGDLHLKGGARR